MDGWMRAVPVGKTYEDNLAYSLYYDPVSRGYSEHGFVGLYKEKAIRAVGMIVNIIKAEETAGALVILESTSPVTPEQKENILKSIQCAKIYGWAIETGHQFFCLDNSSRTDGLITAVPLAT